MNDVILLEELAASGFEARIASIGSVCKIQDELFSLRESGVIDTQLFDEYKQSMIYDYKNIMPEARSVIVMAHPHYSSKLEFIYNSRRHEVVMPPTYIGSAMLMKAEAALERILATNEFSIKYARLPLKLLAARTGLSRYGRNNIAYVEGMGSYHRLFAYYTDYQCQSDELTDITTMQECSSCKVCLNACPTGCIDESRFLIHAENCITYFNEVERDFPTWLRKDWHNAIVGCMKCQTKCPVNSPYKNKLENEFVFEQDETAAILAKTPFDGLSASTRMKLEALDMKNYYNVLKRNLSVLICSEV